MTATPMTAQEFVDSIQHPVFFFVSVGCPCGNSTAIFEGTDLPVNLEEVTGEVVDGQFAADNQGVLKFKDWNGNTIYKIQITNDAAEWKAQYADFEASV